MCIYLACVARVVVIGTVVSASCVAFAGDLPQAHPSDVTRSALDSLSKLLANGRLELSTTDTSDSKNFCFEFILVPSPKIAMSSNRILVLREQDRVAMLIRDLNGNCYAYLTDGLMVAIDHHKPGGFVIMTAGFPQGTFALVPQIGIDFEWSYFRTAPGHHIMVSFGDVLRYLMKVAEFASYDAKTNSYILETRSNVSRLTLAPSNERGTTFFVKDFINKSPNLTMELSFIDSSKIPPNYVGLSQNVSIITSGLYKSGAPIRDLTHEDDAVVDNAVTEAFTVPSDLGASPEERTAISRLTNVLMLHGDATMPSSPPKVSQ